MRQVREKVDTRKFPDGRNDQSKVKSGGILPHNARMIEDLDRIVEIAIEDVFRTMLKLEMHRHEGSQKWLNGEAHIAGGVGFIGGLTGVVYLYLGAGFAHQVTLSMIGMEPAEADAEELINDAVGEIANMVVGQVKSKFVERGVECQLTIPSIVRGSHFAIESVKNTTCSYCYFSTDRDERLLVETLLKTRDSEE